MSNPKPNVIVIVSDTYRPDHIAANGHPYIKTPELDAWLGKTITFDRATVSSFPTIPMRTDWFTGRFSHPRHGWQGLAPRVVTLPQLLREAGYRTQLIGDNTHMLRSQFWRPFEHFHFLRGHEGDAPLSRLNEPVHRVISDLSKVRVEAAAAAPDAPTLADMHAHTNFRRRYEDESQAAELANVACRWVEDNYRGGPFMLWLDCFDVHEPWFPPRYLLDLYARQHPAYGGEAMVHPNYGSASAYSAGELGNLRAHYEAMCTLLSRQVGRVLRTIEDAGLLDNSVVLFMSDHGLYLGERGRTGKSEIRPGFADAFPFYSEVSRICWSMHVPPSLGLDVRPPGTRDAALVQAPDLLPTVLELCGIDLPQGTPIEGRSLVPWLTGEPDQPLREIAITTSTGGVHCRRPTVTDGQWTLVLCEPAGGRPGEKPRLYHVADDPVERVDVFAQHRGEARRLHTAMLAWLTAHDAPIEAIERLSAAHCGLL